MAAGSYDGRATVVRRAATLVVAYGTDGCQALHYPDNFQAFDYRSLWSTTLQTQLARTSGSSARCIPPQSARFPCPADCRASQLARPVEVLQTVVPPAQGWDARL